MDIMSYDIPDIEKALGIKLYDNQKSYLLSQSGLIGGRVSGKTTAFCIRLALSEESLEINKPWIFSDGVELTNHRSYSVGHFRKEFLNIREKLRDYGFKVVDLTMGGKPFETI